jgi:cation diffusion facilitator CzcD-associated flavoprotein CzcO
MTTNTNGHPFHMQDRSIFDVSDQEREKIFEELWAQGGFQFRAAFKDILTSQEANEKAAEFIRKKIREMVKDPVTADLLSDIDHPFAAKRPPVDDNYFDTYNRDNVKLINLRKTPIERITAKGVKTTDQEYDFDIIVFATGFDALTGSLVKMDIEGRDHRKLKDYWSAGPRTYLGLQVPGFPNMFTVTGPGSPSVLCNMPPAIEQHVNWITNCIKHMESKGLKVIETPEASSDYWQQQVNAVANETLLPTVKHSWYLGANVPGKPQVFMPYAGGLARYTKVCNDVAAKGYEGFQFAN